MLLKLICSAQAHKYMHICVYVYRQVYAGMTWPASLLLLIPPILCVVEGEGKAHGSLHSLSPEGGLGSGWWERVALPEPVHWAALAGVCTCLWVCGGFGDRHQSPAPLLLCCR